MTNQTSAAIIPFPAARLSTPFYGPAALCPPGDKLSTALNALSVALAEQKLAVQNWRNAIEELAACMRTLRTGLAKATAPEPIAPSL